MSAARPAYAARDAGQQRSLFDVDVDVQEAFLDVVRALPAGREFTVNDVRDQLDELGVPAKARGGLFSGATKAGLCRPAVVRVDGAEYPKTVPSTGESANAARVRVYVRTGGGPT